jgi:hypothetical protein
MKAMVNMHFIEEQNYSTGTTLAISFKGSFPAVTVEATEKFKKLKLDRKKRIEMLVEQWEI